MAFAVSRKSYLLNAGFVSGDYNSSALQTYSATGLAGQWKLNTDISTSGDAVDSSGNGRDATFALASYRPAYNSTSGPSEYISLTSATFSSGKKAVIGTGGTWDAIIGNDTAGGSTQKMSMSAWVKVETPGNGRVFDFSNGDLYFGYSAGASIEFITRWGGVDANWIGDPSTITYDQWVHIAVTYDATSADNTPIFYINGEKTGVNTLAAPGAGTSYTGIGTIRGCIGNDYAETKHFPGSLADVAIWNTILTPEDISAIYSVAAYGSFNLIRDFNTVGTSVNPPFTGSYAVGLQGINVSRFDLFGISVAPKMGMNGVTTYLYDDNKITIDVSPDARAFFDDSLRLPKRIVATSSGSLGTTSGSLTEVISDDNFRIQQVPRYHLSRQTFGIEKADDPTVPFYEMNSFDPVVYLDNQDQIAWPLVFDVPNSIDPFDFDGAIEPFVLRKTIAGNSTFTGTPDDPEPTGVRGGVSSGHMLINSIGRAIECSNFYKYDTVKAEFFDEGIDLDPEDIALVSEISPSTGSIYCNHSSYTTDSDWSSGLRLQFATAGSVFSATTSTGITAANSTATQIGVSGISTKAELVTAIFNSITQAIQYGVGSTSKDARTDTSSDLDLLWPTISSDGFTIMLTSSKSYKTPLMVITGSLIGNPLGTNPARLTGSGMSNARTDFYEIDIPIVSDFIAPVKGYLDKNPVEEIFSKITSPEIRRILESSISATGRNDLPTGYPGLDFKSKPCGFEYANSNGIDSIVYGGKLK